MKIFLANLVGGQIIGTDAFVTLINCSIRLISFWNLGLLNLDALYVGSLIGLVSIFGLRLAELAVLKVREGNLYVGQVKNNKNTTNQKRKDRRVFAMDLVEKPNLGKKLINLYKSQLIKLPATILTQINLVQKKNRFGDVGQAFRDQLLKNKVWKEIEKKNKDITPYSLRHRFAHQCHKGSNNPISIKDLSLIHISEPTRPERIGGGGVGV